MVNLRLCERNIWTPKINKIGYPSQEKKTAVSINSLVPFCCKHNVFGVNRLKLLKKIKSKRKLWSTTPSAHPVIGCLSFGLWSWSIWPVTALDRERTGSRFPFPVLLELIFITIAAGTLCLIVKGLILQKRAFCTFRKALQIMSRGWTCFLTFVPAGAHWA